MDSYNIDAFKFVCFIFNLEQSIINLFILNFIFISEVFLIFGINFILSSFLIYKIGFLIVFILGILLKTIDYNRKYIYTKIFLYTYLTIYIVNALLYLVFFIALMILLYKDNIKLLILLIIFAYYTVYLCLNIFLIRKARALLVFLNNNKNYYISKYDSNAITEIN